MISSSGVNGPQSGPNVGQYARWETAQSDLERERAHQAFMKAKVAELRTSISAKEMDFVELEMLGRDELRFVQQQGKENAGASSSFEAIGSFLYQSLIAGLLCTSRRGPQRGLAASASAKGDAAAESVSPRQTEQEILRKRRLEEFVVRQRSAGADMHEEPAQER